MTSTPHYQSAHHLAEVKRHWEKLVRKYAEMPFRTDTSHAVANVTNDAINLARGVKEVLSERQDMEHDNPTGGARGRDGTPEELFGIKPVSSETVLTLEDVFAWADGVMGCFGTEHAGKVTAREGHVAEIVLAARKWTPPDDLYRDTSMQGAAVTAFSPDKQETPRTDALEIPSEAFLLLGQKGVPEQIVKAIFTLCDHARQLERELAARNEQLRQSCDEYRAEHGGCCASSAREETMDTAPKDGTPILGFVPSYYEGKGAWVVVLWLGKKGMRDAGWMDNRAWKVEPQCWMPLPAIPSYVGEKK